MTEIQFTDCQTFFFDFPTGKNDVRISKQFARAPNYISFQPQCGPSACPVIAFMEHISTYAGLV